MTTDAITQENEAQPQGSRLPPVSGYLKEAHQGNDSLSGASQKFSTIVADPPWPYKSGPVKAETGGRDGGHYGDPGVRLKAAAMPYATMTIWEICALPVRKMAAKDSHLYLWTTQAFMRDAYMVLDAWNFRDAAILIWSKPPKGVCGTFVCSAEFCIFARRGNLTQKRRQLGTVFEWPRGAHSVKPEAFIDLVESISPGPYLELFARRNRLGWSTWGNECLNHLETTD